MQNTHCKINTNRTRTHKKIDFRIDFKLVLVSSLSVSARSKLDFRNLTILLEHIFFAEVKHFFCC